MGNTPSASTNTKANNEKQFENFYQIIDYIATYYILTMDFKSLSNLSDKDYCDKLVVITSDIIKNHFNDMQITYLAQRIKNGEEVNDLTKEDIMFVNKDKLEGLDIQNDVNKSIKKKRVCIGIAKFYVKIAHIFAAIVKTINPVYVYTDENGNMIKNGLLEKDKIPKNAKRKIYKLNICDNRIRSLNNMNVDDEKKEVNLHPKICNMNLNKDGTVKTLQDEPGISELMQLYLDDNYDYSNGIFSGMSDSTKKKFEKDLKTFYTAFTGKEEMPPDVKKFSDIKLRDYNNKNSCQGANPAFKQNYLVSNTDKLFVEYAKNIKNMIQSASNKQNELLNVINDLFIFVDDPYSDKKKIRVNPKLTEDILQKLVEKTRNIIIELYVKCEMDYVENLKVYEAIVESKILETTKNQIENLEKKASTILTETNKKVAPPVVVRDEADRGPVIQERIIRPPLASGIPPSIPPLASGIPPSIPPLASGIPPPSPIASGIPPPSPIASGIPPPSPLASGIPPPSPLASGIPHPSPLASGIPPSIPIASGIPPPSPIANRAYY